MSVVLVFEHPDVGHQTQVTWQKTRGKGGTYDVVMLPDDGTHHQTFLKTGGTVPEEIAAVFGLNEVTIDKDTKLVPQLHNQQDPPFVIGETGSRQSRILGALTKLDSVVAAQMDARKDGDQFARQAAQALQLQDTYQAELDTLPPIETADRILTTIREKLVVALARLSKCLEVRDIAGRLQRLQALPDPTALGKVVPEARSILADYERKRALVARWTQAILDWGDAGRTRQQALNAVAEYEQAYEDACVEQGRCPGCMGLLDHQECVA